MDYSKKSKADLKALCKERKIKGITGKNVKDLIKMLSDYDEKQLCDSFTNKNTIAPVSASTIEAKTDIKNKEPIKVDINASIEDLESLKNVLENKEAQRGLIALYKQSQSECTRNGNCGMEVGMSREKDQGAVLKLFLGNKINLDIDNNLPEDYIIGNSKISAKHSSGEVGSTVKAKWTSADVSVKEAIEEMINAEDSYYPNLLLTYFDIKNKIIIILCISSKENKKVIKTLKHEAFTIPKGNARGIEYSKKAMNELIKNNYFKIEIPNVDLKSGVNPIERRIQLLKSMDINCLLY